jgi:hypothetical protein
MSNTAGASGNNATKLSIESLPLQPATVVDTRDQWQRSVWWKDLFAAVDEKLLKDCKDNEKIPIDYRPGQKLPTSPTMLGVLYARNKNCYSSSTKPPSSSQTPAVNTGNDTEEEDLRPSSRQTDVEKMLTQEYARYRRKREKKSFLLSAFKESEYYTVGLLICWDQ